MISAVLFNTCCANYEVVNFNFVTFNLIGLINAQILFSFLEKLALNHSLSGFIYPGSIKIDKLGKTTM